MKQQIRCIVITFFLVWLGASDTQASILIVSPHPDDDILIAAGITYAATTRREQVTVIYITNGDFTGTAQGYLRQDEAVNGQVGNLGTSEEDLIFLGYPDGHLGVLYNDFKDPNSVFTTYFGQSTTYGDRGLGGMDYHRYRFGASATYNSYNLVLDLRDIIATRRPQHILTTADFDKHPDHVATFLAVRDAVLAVTAANPSYSPTLEKSLVWSSDPFSGSFSWPNELDPQGYFEEPPELAMAGVQWNQRLSLDVPLPMQSRDLFANLKYLALQSHASQGGGDNIFLSAFIHKDEVNWAQAVRGGNRPPRVDAGTDQAVIQGQNVQLDGSGSSDPDGTALTYQWRQVSGKPVTLIGATTARPSFLAPATLVENDVLAFELIVSDGLFQSLPDHVSVWVHDGGSTNSNIASLAAVTASSQNDGSNQQAVKAVDGVVDGYPGDYTKEWATLGQKSGAWLELNWTSTYQIDRVVLHDRPNSEDQIIAAALTFSDGSTVTVGPLTNSGAGVEVRFGPVATSRVRVTVTAVSATTQNIGLAELEVYGVPASGGNRMPIANAGADQTVTAGAAVTLDGRASSDPDGDALSYRWNQTAGQTVTLTNSTSATPGFTAPTGLTSNIVLTFSLIVNDGRLDSSADTVNVTVTAGTPTGNSIAAFAAVTASSQNTSTNQQAVKAVDGVADGYPGDYTKEWATLGQKAGAWLELNWSTTYQIDRIVLHDRPNNDDQITGATLAFSDGSTVMVGPLTNSGAGVEVRFGPVVTSRVRVTVTAVSASSQNIGLAELEVYGVPASGGNSMPVANAGADQTVTAGAAVTLDGRASSDPDGDALSYRWSQTAGQAVTLNSTSATPGFTAPTGLTTNTVLTFSLIVNDGQLDSNADTVNVTVTAGTPTGSNVASLAAVTASSQNTGTNQQAVKAVDRVVDGYPGDYTKEWATLGQRAGAWLELNWTTTYQIDRIVLYDRPNSDDQITGATLTFSDGSTVTVGALTNSGAGVEVRFGPVVTSRVRVTVTAASAGTQNIGLAELEVYGR